MVNVGYREYQVMDCILYYDYKEMENYIKAT